MNIVIWDFSVVSGKSNRFYLNQAELALTFRLEIFLVAILLYKS